MVLHHIIVSAHIRIIIIDWACCILAIVFLRFLSEWRKAIYSKRSTFLHSKSNELFVNTKSQQKKCISPKVVLFFFRAICSRPRLSLLLFRDK